MNAWERAKAEAEKATAGGGLYVRLTNDGDKVVGAFCGDPHVKKVHWDGQKNTDCTERDDCPACKVGTQLRTRIQINLYAPEVNAMRIFEGGPEWFKDLLALREKYGFDAWLFEVQRRGTKGDPKTKYSMLPEAQITSEVRGRMARVPPIDLARFGRDESKPAAPMGASPSAAPDGIDVATLKELADRLRPFDKAEIQAFLAAFRIQRLRDLLPSQLEAARAYVAKLEGPVPGGEDENEPWAA